MSEHQAIYDAVRSRIHNGDVGAAIERAVSNAGLSHEAHMANVAIQNAVAQYERPSVLYRPALYIDGDKYCALYGADIMSGCAGFGATAAKAMADFDKHWFNSNPPSRAVKCKICGEVMSFDAQPDGCRVPNCPMAK